MMNWKHLVAACVAVWATGANAQAPDLIIGRGNEQVSMDPQFARTGNNQYTAQHIFDRLVDVDENLRAGPGLAVSWRNIDPLTWEVKLRPNVKFHDGSPFTAEDVVFSLRRPPTIPNSPASFASSVAGIASMEIIDPLTLKITSKTPDPRLIEEAGRVYILSKKAAEGATNEAFTKGAATIGTGPYKYVDWTPGATLNLIRNEDYFGRKPDFQRVQMRFITNAAARVAALKAGDVHLIDVVPPNFAAELKNDPKFAVAETDSLTLVYLALDSARDKSPYVTDLDGKPLDKNPLKDVRVRRALSMMIDRPQLVARVLSGAGSPASQIVPEGVFGHDPETKPTAYNLDGAKKLLAEAGWEKGFGITLFGSNDRFLNDANVIQTVGQLFARGGIKINGVQALPYAVFARNATEGQYSIFQFSIGSTTGEASASLNSVLHTPDAAAGLGGNNRTKYSNKDYDAVLEQALAEFDMVKREKLLRDATKIAFADVAIIPLYWQRSAWATRQGVVYSPQRDEGTVAMNARRK